MDYWRGVGGSGVRRVGGSRKRLKQSGEKPPMSRLPHGGAIVNVSSMAGRLGGAFEYVDYAASKGRWTR